MRLTTELPIDEVLDEIAAALESPGSAVVVVAPPGDLIVRVTRRPLLGRAAQIL